MTKLVTIVGVGALGSHVVQFLRGEEIQIRVVDHDRVEQKNTLAQFHPKMTLGRTKVEAIRGTMDLLWGVKIDRRPIQLVPGNVAQLLQDADLVIDCLDNGTGRRVIQEFARGCSIPCLHAGLAADGAFARVLWDEHFTIDDEPDGGAPTCEGAEHLPFIATVAGYVAQAAQTFLRQGEQIGWMISPGKIMRI